MNKKAKKTTKKTHTLQFFAAKTTKKILQMFYDMQNSLNIIVTPEGYVWFSEKRQILTGLCFLQHILMLIKQRCDWFKNISLAQMYRNVKYRFELTNLPN